MIGAEWNTALDDDFCQSTNLSDTGPEGHMINIKLTYFLAVP
jgi:hypothetical protein